MSENEESIMKEFVDILEEHAPEWKAPFAIIAGFIAAVLIKFPNIDPTQAMNKATFWATLILEVEIKDLIDWQRSEGSQEA